MVFTVRIPGLKVFAFFIIFITALLISVLLSPEKASAAAITLSTATTSSNNASTTLAKVGNTVSYRLVLSGTPVATSSPVINIFNMGTTSMSGSGTTWTYSTTSASTWTEGFVTFYMAWGGTATEATTTISQTSLTSANVKFDQTAPTISTITSNATASGVLKVGDTIIFTLTPGATEYGATVAGSYNSQSLTWSTGDSGATFTATYTVTEGETDRSSALQISSVVITDAAGNASSAGSSSNVAKTIDANSPGTPTATPAGGTSSANKEDITLASSGSDSIYYTDDGSTPTCSSGTLYSSTFSINTTQTIKAIGCDTAGNDSAVASFSYTITSSGGGGGGGSRRSSASVTASVSSSGLSGNQVESILGLLRSFGADAATIAKVNAALMGQTVPSTTSAPASSFVRNLTLGSSGQDVKALQIFLNTNGFTVAATGPGSAGNETMTFGALTRAALAKFQAAKGISPALGYFGPLTRAAILGR